MQFIASKKAIQQIETKHMWFEALPRTLQYLYQFWPRDLRTQDVFYYTVMQFVHPVGSSGVAEWAIRRAVKQTV